MRELAPKMPKNSPFFEFSAKCAILLDFVIKRIIFCGKIDLFPALGES